MATAGGTSKNKSSRKCHEVESFETPVTIHYQDNKRRNKHMIMKLLKLIPPGDIIPYIATPLFIYGGGGGRLEYYI